MSDGELQVARRYQGDGFDLDLVYVTSRVLAMSMPAHQPGTQLYRNSIQEAPLSKHDVDP